MIIQFQDSDVYDGWICEADTEKGTIAWRDAWFVERMSDEKKREIENIIKKEIFHGKRED